MCFVDWALIWTSQIIYTKWIFCNQSSFVLRLGIFQYYTINIHVATSALQISSASFLLIIGLRSLRSMKKSVLIFTAWFNVLWSICQTVLTVEQDDHMCKKFAWSCLHLLQLPSACGNICSIFRLSSWTVCVLYFKDTFSNCKIIGDCNHYD